MARKKRSVTGKKIEEEEEGEIEAEEGEEEEEVEEKKVSDSFDDAVHPFGAGAKEERTQRQETQK